MHLLSNESELRAVSGGFGAYDTGAAIGNALRTAFEAFAKLGGLYPTDPLSPL